MVNEDLYDTFLSQDWNADFQHHSSRDEAPLECIIVEPRSHPRLPAVLANMSAQFPYAALTVYHSAENETFVKEAIQQSSKVMLTCFTKGNIDRDDYNSLLMSTAFWAERPCKHTLIFQTDTGCRKNRVLRYLHYGYVGAPWTWTCIPSDPLITYGNGGFSLRNSALMRQILYDHVPPSGWNEDVYFSKCAYHYDDFRMPTMEVASSFAIEYNDHPDPMAFHQAWGYHSRDKVEAWLNHKVESLGSVKGTLLDVSNITIVSEKGDMVSGKALKGWVRMGISREGLFIPAGSRPPINEIFSGQRKHIKLELTDASKVYTVFVHMNRGAVDKDVLVKS